MPDMSRPWRPILVLLALAMGVYHLFYTQYMILGPIEHQNLHYGMALVLVFLSLINRTGSKATRLWLFIMIILSVASTTYVFAHFTALQEIRGPLYRLTTMDCIMGAILLLVGLEASRRAFGLVFAVVAMAFMFYAYFGHYLKGPLATSPIPIKELLTVYAMGLQGGLYGDVLGTSANYIFLFVLFGGVLGVTGASRFFMKVGQVVASKMAGGPAITSVISSALMGSVTGSAMANVATTGAFTIPMMKKVGYKSHQAGAIEAAASTGGQIMPPVMGAAAFVMADMVELPYFKIMIAAALPSLLYFFSVGVYAQLQAKRMRIDGSGILDSKVDRGFFWDSLIFLLPLFVVIGLLVLNYSPMFSVFWSLMLLIFLNLVIGYFRKESNLWQRLKEGFVEGAVSGAKIAVTCAVLGPIIATVTKTVLGLKIPGVIGLWCGGNVYLALIITMFACIILGMGVPTVAAYVLVALVGAPILIKLGVPLLAAHMFVFVWAVFSCLTPPIAVSALPAAGIAKASYMRTAAEASLAGFVGFLVPFLVVFAPELMILDAPLSQVALSLLCSVMAIMALGTAITGYSHRKLYVPERLLFLAISAMIFSYVLTKALPILFIGLAAYIGQWSWQRWKAKREAADYLDSKSPSAAPRAE